MNTSLSSPVDVLIVGAGAAGMTAALYALRAKKSALVLEKAAFGGQILETDKIENYPAAPGISGSDFSKALKSQVESFGGKFAFAEVESLEEVSTKPGKKPLFKVKTDSGEFYGKSVILANGSTERRLNLPHEAELTGHGVSFCATCDGALFKGKTIAVYGGGNTALYSALYLSPLAKKLFLIHRRSEFRADPALVEKLPSLKNLELVLGETVKSLVPSSSTPPVLDSLVLSSGRELKLDALFVSIGRVPDNLIFKDFIDLDADGFISSDETCKTSRPGVFCAGDCRKKPLNQLVTAASDGAVAATAAINFLNS